LNSIPYSPKSKSVLMVTGALARGGAERQMLHLAHGLLLAGYDVQLYELQDLAPGQPGFHAEMGALGVTSYRHSSFSQTREPASTYDHPWLTPFVPILPQNYLTIAEGLAAAIEALRPSVVYCWSDFSNVMGGYIGGLIGVPRIVFGLRVMPPPVWFPVDQAELYRTAYGLLLANPAVVLISNCEAGAIAFEKWLPRASGRIKIVYSAYQPLGAPTDRRTERRSYRTARGIPADALLVCGMMRLSEEKDPKLWIDTAAAISGSRPDAYFLLAGFGHDDTAETLFKRAADLGFGSRLLMPGAVTNVAEVYAASDVLLLTSRTETLPNVLIEAQATGLPVVAPDVGGISETMLDGLTGILVRGRSATLFANALLEIFDAPGFTDRAARMGPDFVKRRFGLERMINETVRIFD
jgi:glycosyltransferase involved in cell wall biosynthesis